MAGCRVSTKIRSLIETGTTVIVIGITTIGFESAIENLTWGNRFARSRGLCAFVMRFSLTIRSARFVEPDCVIQPFTLEDAIFLSTLLFAFSFLSLGSHHPKTALGDARHSFGWSIGSARLAPVIQKTWQYCPLRRYVLRAQPDTYCPLQFRPER
jgi:hypothetical protein